MYKDGCIQNSPIFFLLISENRNYHVVTTDTQCENVFTNRNYNRDDNYYTFAIITFGTVHTEQRCACETVCTCQAVNMKTR